MDQVTVTGDTGTVMHTLGGTVSETLRSSRTVLGIAAATLVVVGCAALGLRLLSHDDAATATSSLGQPAMNPPATTTAASDPEGVVVAPQWKLDAIDLRDQEGHFSGTATISYQGAAAQQKTFTITLFQCQAQVATLSGQAAVAPGTAAMVELDSQDPFVPGTTGYVPETGG